MPGQTWVQTLSSAQTDGPAVTTNGSDTSMLPTGAVYLLPGSSLSIGSALRFKAWGRASSAASPGTVTLTIYFGAVKVFTSQAITQIASQTNLTYEIDLKLTCRAIGSGTSTTFMGTGRITSGVFGAAGVVTTVLMPVSAPAVGTGFDSTASQLIDLRANFSVTGQSWTLHQYILESMN